eukprot:6357064-Ditylum_brightwellii.AAC.1
MIAFGNVHWRPRCGKSLGFSMAMSLSCCSFVKDIAAKLGQTTMAHLNLSITPCLCSNYVSIWREPACQTPNILDPLCTEILS